MPEATWRSRCVALAVGLGCVAIPAGSEAQCANTLYYADTDADGFGDPLVSTCAASMPPGYVLDSTDCNDSAATINPGASEVCDPSDVDEDCDGVSDNLDASVSGTVVFYTDADNDGYGDAASGGVQRCDPIGSEVPNGTDCDDAHAAAHPGGSEVCDPDDVDEDCDGLADALDPGATGTMIYYPDADGDGYGDASAPTPRCDSAPGWVQEHTDCDDANGAINPGTNEVCDPDDVDEDCNLSADNLDPGATGQVNVYYPDSDGDGYADSASGGVPRCDPNAGELTTHTDCDDSRAQVHPGGTERCNGRDDDCNGDVDDDPGCAEDAGTSKDAGAETTAPDAAPPDAGVRDAGCDDPSCWEGSIGTDAGDAGATSKPPEARDAGADAGAEEGGDEGCGCRVVGAGRAHDTRPMSRGLLLGLITSVVAVRQRRKTERSPRART